MLSESCFGCHGPDSSEHGQAAGLRLDHFEGATRILPSGNRAIVPGNPDAGELMRRIMDESDPMPPLNSHKRMLSPEESAALRQWIKAGAEYETHWAFKPLVRPDVPDMGANHPVDNFIAETLQQQGVEASPSADALTLIRRLSLDLTGLPPEPSVREAYLADPSDARMAGTMEMMLAGERHAEHMTEWWLDLVRYADTIGFHSDNPRVMWVYREWVINAFLNNMPFDEFSTMQLAGDFMVGMDGVNSNEAVIASSYNRLAPVTEEGGAQPGEYEVISLVDRVSNLGNVWMGLTTGCAQCHNHKFDPVSQRDFYRLGAFFADIDENPIYTGAGGFQKDCQLDKELPYDERGGYRPYQRLPSLAQQRNLDELDRRIRESSGEEHRALLQERKELEDRFPIVNGVERRDEPRTVRVLARGNWMDESGEIVTPGVPEFLGSPLEAEGATRLDLARWLFRTDNPLVSRVVVNRLWARYYGKGLSRDLIDLGAQGDPPSHPELLDWLACEFVDSGWDLRHITRLILTSEAWKMSSDIRPGLLESDPDNRWLARQNAQRLSAEAVRDQVLLLSGLLNESLGGKSIFPYQPEGHWSSLNFPKRTYPQSSGPELYRRSLYIWMQRTFPHPEMTTLDAPNRESCTARRNVSNTPLQALMVLNSPTHVEAARVLAGRVITDGGVSEADRMDWLAHAVWGRPLRADESAVLSRLLRTQIDAYSGKEEAAALVAVGEAPMNNELDIVEHAAWTQVCRAVLNTHETLVRR